MKLDPEGEDSDLEEDWQSGLHNSHLEVTLETHEDEQLEISYGGGLEDSGEVDEETADFDSEGFRTHPYEKNLQHMNKEPRWNLKKRGSKIS